MPSKHLASLTADGGEEPVLQYSPMCGVWALTPYDACDLRCSYCASYAQGPSAPRATAAEIRALLERELPSVPREHAICLGAIIDCYTHAEAEHGLTRAALEVLVAAERDLVIVTKGTLIERDLDLLRGYERVAVNVSLPSLDEEVLADIEPHAPSGAERFALIERLAEAGIAVQLHVQPWIPGMTDALAAVEAAAGRFKVWFAPLNVQNPVIARSRWGKRFTQREINEAYVAEMKRVGPRPNVRWARPLWLGDDLLAMSQWRSDTSACALADDGDDGRDRHDPLRRPELAPRWREAGDRAAIEARDVALTGEIIAAIAAGQLPVWGMARLSAHLRFYDAAYPERRLADEGRGGLGVVMALVDVLAEPEVAVLDLRADGPVVRARYAIGGELASAFGDHAAGDHVTASVDATHRFDAHGLLVEAWFQAAVEATPPGAAALDAARPARAPART